MPERTHCQAQLRNAFRLSCGQSYSGANLTTVSAAERVRQKVIALMDERGYSQREMARRLERSQPWVAKVIRGPLKAGQDVRLEDLDDVALALGVTAVELVRDHGLEFVANLTPSEMRMLQQIRKLPAHVIEAVRVLIDAPNRRMTAQSDTGSRRKPTKAVR